MSAPDVRSQYEQYPYPPRDPREEAQRLVETQGDFLDVVNHHCFGGRQRYGAEFRALAAGCGTGDAAVFLAEQLRETGGEVVALDFSEASLAVARARAEARGLRNLRFVRAPLQELPSLGLGAFDFINCTGVLHHLADPEAGLRALAGSLREGGAMHLMLYAALGRAPIYAMQALLRTLAGPALGPAERVRRARRVIDELPPDNPFKRDFATKGHDILHFGDAGLFDLLLHAQDRAYTVPQVYELLERAGLHLVTFAGGARAYDPAAYLQDPVLLGELAGRPARERHAVGELLAGNLSTHAFYAAARLPAALSPEDATAIPYIPSAWADRGAHLALHEEMRRHLGRPMRISLRGDASIGFTPSPAATALMRHVDGDTTVGEILSRVALEEPAAGGRDGTARAFGALYAAFSSLEWMLLRRPESRRIPTGAELQTRMLAAR